MGFAGLAERRLGAGTLARWRVDVARLGKRMEEKVRSDVRNGREPSVRACRQAWAVGLGATLLLEVAWSGVRVARQTGESAAAIVRALEGAVVAVVEAAGVQAEATVSKVFEWMALILALWAVWALGRWWKHQEMMMAGFSAGKKRGKRNTDAGKKGEPEGQELSPLSARSAASPLPAPNFRTLRAKARLEEEGRRTRSFPALPPSTTTPVQTTGKRRRNQRLAGVETPSMSPVGKEKTTKDPAAQSRARTDDRSVVPEKPIGAGPIRTIELLRSATEAQECAVQVLTSCAAESAKKEVMVRLTAYAIDRPELFGALKVAQDRGCDVEVYVDKSQTGRTTEQKRLVHQARSQGLKIFIANGESLGPHYAAAGRTRYNFCGALHGKTLMVKKGDQLELIIGSMNWTTASRGNHEIGLHLTLGQEDPLAIGFQEWVSNVKQFACDFQAAVASDAYAEKSLGAARN